MDNHTVKVSNDIEFPEKEITAFIEAEFELLRKKIESNIYASRKNATGKTIKSMRVEKSTEGDFKTISLFGRENFDNLETGTPPGAQQANFVNDIYDWVMAKFPISGDYGGLAFAVNTSRMIREKGSFMYRAGDHINIFSEERIDSYKKIDDFIDNRIEWFLKTIEL